MKKVFVLVIVLCVSYTYSVAQRCGGGTKTLRFFAKYHQQPDTIYYEVTLANRINFAKLLPAAKLSFEEWESHIRYNINSGIIVTAAELENCLLNVPDSMDHASRNHMQNLEQVTTKGIVKDGEIKFPTSENNRTPYLLKLTAGDKTTYFIHYLLGGCDRTIALLWDKKNGFYKCGY